MRMTPLWNKHWEKWGCLTAVFGFSKCHGNPTNGFDFLTSVRFGFSETDSESTFGFPHISNADDILLMAPHVTELQRLFVKLNLND